MSSWRNQINKTAASMLLLASMCAQAAPSLRAPSLPVHVGDTINFTVSDDHIADATDPDLGIEAIDFAFNYGPALQYVGAASLLPDAFLTAPDLSVDPDPLGSFYASWVRLADGTTPTDLFTVSFKVLSLPAGPLDGALSLSHPDGGAYGVVGSYLPTSATVTAVPEPLTGVLALSGVLVLLGLGRRPV